MEHLYSAVWSCLFHNLSSEIDRSVLGAWLCHRLLMGSVRYYCKGTFVYSSNKVLGTTSQTPSQYQRASKQNRTDLQATPFFLLSGDLVHFQLELGAGRSVWRCLLWVPCLVWGIVNFQNTGCLPEYQISLASSLCLCSVSVMSKNREREGWDPHLGRTVSKLLVFSFKPWFLYLEVVGKWTEAQSLLVVLLTLNT